jgi:hypothetical protein
MGKGKASGIILTNKSASIVLGMVARGDRDHDIAAWFGVNQGRIAEVKAGEFGGLTAAPPNELPPKGPPGLKGRRLREAASKMLQQIQDGAADLSTVKKSLEEALHKFDEHEA